MNREEEFKKSLNEILDSKEFAFNEANWAGALDLINARKKRRRAAFILFPLLGLLAGGIVTLFLINGRVTTLPNKQTMSVVTPDPAANPNPNHILQAVPAPAVNHTESVSQPSQKPVTPIASPAKEPANVGTNTYQKLNTSKTNNLAVSPPANSNSSVKSMPVFHQNNAGHTLPPPIVPNNGKSPITGEPQSVPSGAAGPEPTQTNTVNVPAANMSTNDSAKTTVSPPPETLALTQPTTATILSEKQGPAETSKTLQAPSGDTLKTMPKPQAPDPVNFLTLEAGSSYNFGWKNTATREAAGFTPVFGLHFTSQLARKVSFSLGAQYNNVSNLSFSNKESIITRYSLGEENKVTVITPTTLYYLNFPLKLMYDVDVKNKVGIGYNIAYLFNVQSKVETYTVYPTYTGNYQTYYTAGYTEGIGIFNSQASVIYRRQLWRDLWLNTELFAGLSDVKNNVFFNVTKSERVAGVKVTLMYHLFKK